MIITIGEFGSFKQWLNANGAEVLTPTNPYELIRFRSVNGVSVIYTGKRGQTFTGESEKAFKLFKEGKRWVATDRKRKAVTQLKRTLAARDGHKCFWCDTPNEINKLTVEHILSKMHGGNDNTNNLSLACDDCQNELGTMSITEKILFRQMKLGHVRVTEMYVGIDPAVTGDDRSVKQHHPLGRWFKWRKQ